MVQNAGNRSGGLASPTSATHTLAPCLTCCKQTPADCTGKHTQIGQMPKVMLGRWSTLAGAQRRRLEDGWWWRAGGQALEDLEVVQEQAHCLWIQLRKQVVIDSVVDKAVPLCCPGVGAGAAAAQAHHCAAGQLVGGARRARVALAHAAHGEWLAYISVRGAGSQVGRH